MEVTVRPCAAVALRVDEASQVGEVRRTAAALGAESGFDEVRSGRLAIVATELATNLVKHGGGGEVLLRRTEDGRRVELLALDRGAGMRDVAASFRDGFSTAGTAGNGLGAVARLADRWDVYSAADAGTAVAAWFGASEAGAALEIGAVCLAHRGETVAGDAWSVAHEPDRSVFIVADGLGHGAGAHAAAVAAVASFHDNAGRTPKEIVEAAHVALRGTRGAAVGVAEIDRRRGAARFAGVGNIAGTIVTGGTTRSFVSHGGIVGHECRRVHEFEYEWPDGALLVLHSDGLQTSWKLSRYPGLDRRHPALVAGVLYRDYTRGRDDITVLAARAAGA